VLSLIVTNLNQNRIARYASIKDYKTKANSNAEDYKQNKTNANYAGASSTDIQKQIATLTADMAALDTASASAQTSLTNNELLVVAQKAKIDGLKSTQKGYDTTLAQLAGTKISLTTSIAKMQSDMDSNSVDSSKYQIAYLGALSKIDGLIQTYQPECADMGNFMTTGRASLIADKNTNTYITNIKKALAVNN